MTKDEMIENMFEGLLDTSTYDWMTENSDKWQWDNQRIVVVGDNSNIPDWVLRDFQMWNEDIERISRM